MPASRGNVYDAGPNCALPENPGMFFSVRLLGLGMALAGHIVFSVLSISLQPSSGVSEAMNNKYLVAH